MNEAQLDAWAGGGRCWFCGTGAPSESRARSVALKKPGAERSLRSSVAVPRCESCAQAHAASAQKGCTLALLSGGVMLIVGLALGHLVGLSRWYQLGLVISGLAAGALRFGGGTGLPPGIKPDGSASQYPGVTMMLDEGWCLDGLDGLPA